MRITLYNAQQGYEAYRALWPHIKAHLMAGRRVVVQANDETRRDSQNRKFHAICGDLARSQFEWEGRARPAIQWKPLLVSGHAIATQEEVELIRGLEGELINVRESTALMSVARSASLIEYALAFCAMHRIPTVEAVE